MFRSRGFQLPSVFSIFTGYNTPEASKHRKRQVGNLSGETIANHAKHLFTCLQCSYWAIPAWHTFRDDVESLARSLSGYADYLGKKNKQMKFLHSQLQPVRTVGDNLQFQYLPSASVVLPDFEELERALKAKNQFQSLQLESLCPQNPSKRYEFLKKLKNIGLPFPTAMLTYSHGNNVGSLNFLWCVPDKSDSTFSSCQGVIESVKEMLPVYKTRAMRSAAFNKFGRLSSNLTPIAFRYIYKDLTGDHSTPANLDQAEIEKRVQLLVDMEDADVVLDLRHLNSGRKSMYDAFWDESSKFIQDSIGQAVDDRRHQQVTHLATAISVNDFVTQVSRRCPDGTQIPSEAWVRLQFWPKNKHHKSSCHYTGKLDVKFMVQSRQLRKSHDNAHYCAALFRYEREQAILLRDNSMFACLDDKHRIPVGEPGYPVASVERGRRVIVSRNTDFLVADHDFTRFSIVPSVTLFVDIPDEISESWYTGQVYVTLKEGSMEPSSPLRHATELVANIQSEFSDVKPVLFLYTDGGPDHRITYLSVQLSLISVFLFLDLDYLCAVRTAPAQSWKNPVERIMSILNLGLQSVGLMREQGSEQAEQSLKNCNNFTQIRAAVANNSNLAGEISDSIEPVKILLSDIFQRLHLKDKAVKVSPSTTQTRMEELNKNLDAIEEVSLTEKTPKSILKKLPKLAAFIDHCCQSRHYSFCIKKCGEPTCEVCQPVRLPSQVFKSLHFLPDPVPSDDEHYKLFDEVYGSETTEMHRPSLVQKSKRRKTLPFTASIQHVKNVNLIVQCEQCGMWRLIYSPYKLKAEDKRILESKLDSSSFWLFCNSGVVCICILVYLLH